MTLPSELQDALRGLPSTEAAGAARVWQLATAPDAPASTPERVDALWTRIAHHRHLASRHAPHDQPGSPPRPISLIDKYERPPVVRVPKSRRILRWVLPALTLLVAAGVWWRYATVTLTAVGTHLLSGGSTATLSPGSTLRYSRANARTVALTGEATFDVVATAQQPFTVETPNARVEVLGTLFTVAAPTAGATRVNVSRGTVALSPLDGSGRVSVAEGQFARVEGRTLSRVAQSPSSTMAAVHANDLPLGQFVDSLGARYGIRIAIPDSLRERPWTVHLEGPVRLDDVFGAIAAPLSLSWTADSAGDVTFAPRR